MVLVIALSALYWFVMRVLPKTSGEVAAPVSAAASITRDEHGVPHIHAGGLEDALFLQGYAVAQDRLWQMDTLRRFATGELAEIVGKSALETDLTSRRLRIRRIAEEQYRSLKPEDRIVMAAFARGVNYFIETHRQALPVEFTILRYDPRPWSVIDSLAVGLHMYRTLTTSWENEILKRNLLAGGEPQMVQFLFPPRAAIQVQPGSNAWVVSGKRTASGKPILANDPHLEFSNPSTWYLNHLQAPGLIVTGASLPGMPGVIVGHNDHIAWGVTNLHFDVQDLYIEKLNLQTGQYVFKGQVRQARAERELVAIKGEKPAEFVNWVTLHGPVWQTQDGQTLTLRWMAAEPGVFEFPFIDIDTATNWQDFTKALSRFAGPGQNFVYADTAGNIGYHATGKLPIRKSYGGDLPVDGSSGENEWEGFVPFEQLPTLYNPPSGMIVTANQNPFPADSPYRVSGEFAPYYRVKQIRDMLTAKPQLKPEDMLVVQKDVYSSLSLYLAREVVKAFDKRGAKNPSLTDAIEVLRNWNGQMEKGQPAPFLVTLIYQHLRRAMADRASPGKGQLYEVLGAGPVLEKLLRERPDGWFSDYDQLLLRSLVDATEEGRRIQGKNVRKWDYGRYNELTIRQPVVGRIPWVGEYFNIGPVPMSGSSTTVKQTTRRLGPSMRMVVDLGNFENSLQNLTIGESGQVFSWRYKDQWDAYYSGHSFPMRFGKVDGSELKFVPAK